MTAVLVTGAGGFIGGRVLAHLQSVGQPTCADRLPGAAREDLTPSGLFARLGTASVQAIIHAAGSGTVGQVAAAPERELPSNLAAALAVLEFARLRAPLAHVVMLSSAALYGNAPSFAQAETEARTPVSLYGVAKAQVEQLAAHYATQYGLTVTVVRLFSVYGPGLRKQLLWDAMNKFAAGGGEFFGTGQEQRDWIHIDDVCRFMGQLLHHSGTPGSLRVVNCAAGQSATTADVLTLLAAAAGAPPPRFNGQVRAGDPACLVADCSKAERELGWRASVPWREGVAQYAAWFTAQGSVVPAASALPKAR